MRPREDQGVVDPKLDVYGVKCLKVTGEYFFTLFPGVLISSMCLNRPVNLSCQCWRSEFSLLLRSVRMLTVYSRILHLLPLS